MKTLICIFAFSLAGVSLGQSRSVLRPLQPHPIFDDAFTCTIDQANGAPLLINPWVMVDPKLPTDKMLEDNMMLFSLQTKRKVEIRLFEIQGDVSFQKLEEEMAGLIRIGFRKTSLRHLAGFCNNRNARYLKKGVMIIASERPIMATDDPNKVRCFEALYGAEVLGESILIRIVKPEEIPKAPVRIVILEAPR